MLYAYVPSGIYRKNFFFFSDTSDLGVMRVALLHECIFLAVVFGIANLWEGLLMFFSVCFFTYKDISHFGIWCSSTKTQFLSKFRGWGWDSSKFLSTFPLEKMSFSEPRAHELPRLAGQQGLVICPKHWSWRPVKPHQAFTLVPKIQIQVPILVQQILYWLSHFSNSNF